MEVTPLALPEVKIIRTKKHGDHRGFFSETYTERTFRDAGIDLRFVQDNHSKSAERGTIRGLHFQLPPVAQHKLVRVTRGAILDVALDVRRGSPTFGRHVTAIISADAWNQVLVPVGFAHGFCTLEPDTEVIYKVTDYYSPDRERGVLWNDPALAIAWPVTERDAVLSGKDKSLPILSALTDLL